MKLVRVRVGDSEAKVIVGDGFVEVKESVCPYRLAKTLRKLVYGVKVEGYYGSIVVVPRRKSGLTPLGKKLVRRYFPRYAHLIRNQIPLVLLALVVGIAVVCNVNPNLPLCKALTESYWKVILPILALGLGMYVAKEVVS